MSEGFPDTRVRPPEKSDEAIICFRSDAPTEAIAATELQRYLAELTGRRPRLVDEVTETGEPTAPLVLSVGRTRRVAALLANQMLAEPRARDPEAYLVRSLSHPDHHEVIFLGGSGIATLYAVYHYLEECCGIGFFWDGDRVPRRAAIPVEGIDLATQPYFNDRIYFNPCLWYYSTPWWGWEEWRHYLDWMVKNRFNTLDMGWSPGLNALWQDVWAEFGVVIADASWSGPPYDLGGSYSGIEPPLPSAWREGRAALHRQIVDYARARGMRIVGPHVTGAVPPEFLRTHPDAPVYRTVWAGFPPQYYLDPTSPTYREVGRAFLRAYIDRYGSDHLYQLANLGELELEEPEEIRSHFRRTIAHANFTVMREVDPEGIGILPTWTYLGKGWPPSETRESIEQLPRRHVRVLDFWAEQVPLYRELDYFFGAPWYFGVFHSFGGDTHLHGNVPLLERRLKAILDDRRAGGCAGFALMNEVSGHNYFYYQFVARLGWHPAEVDLRTFVQSYVQRRYGEPAAKSMEQCLDELLRSVYGTDNVPSPFYWHRPGHRIRADVAESERHLGPLRRALERALEAAPAARDNPYYRHDLNDIARHYLATLAGTRQLALAEALRQLDATRFEQEADLIKRCLQTIEELLGLDEYYWLEPTLRSARALPGAPADVERRVRDVLTRWAGQIRDYAARDLFELVHGYYRPRVDACLEELRHRLANWQGFLDYQPGEVRLERQYNEIEQQWVQTGGPAIPRRPDPRAVIEVVQRLVQELPGPVGDEA